MSECEHQDFRANVTVNRIEDSGLFNADIRVDCANCGEPFKFVGLPMGVNLHGATVSPDLVEARMAIAPLSPEDKERYLVMNGVKPRTERKERV